jgi:hypothetical protein
MLLYSVVPAEIPVEQRLRRLSYDIHSKLVRVGQTAVQVQRSVSPLGISAAAALNVLYAHSGVACILIELNA